MYYTYAHYTKNTNQIFYIGKGRWYGKDQTQRYLQRTNRNKWWINKVNKHDFNAVILCKFKTEKEALEHEKLLIATFKDLNYELVNLTNGGEGSSGRLVSEETRLKLSQSNKGKKRNISESEKERLRLLAKQMADKNRGKKLTKEHKDKINKNRKPPKKIIAYNDKEEIIMAGLKNIKEKGFDPSRVYRALRENGKYKGYNFKEQND